MLFQWLSYIVLLPNFRWFPLATQPTRASDASQLVSWHLGMCCQSRSRNTTLCITFLGWRSPMRLSLWHLRIRNLTVHEQRSTSSYRTLATTAITRTTMRRRRSTLPLVTQRTRSCIVTLMNFSTSWTRLRSPPVDCELCWATWASPLP
jgi:hypothetical protein